MHHLIFHDQYYKVLGLTSIKIGMAPSKGITSADEANVNAGTITPSPGLSFKPSKANNNASVPLEQHKTYLELEKILNCFSNSFTSGPRIYCP